MKSLITSILASFVLTACALEPIDAVPPAPPTGIRTISLDNAVQLDWIPNSEADLAGYNVWVSDRYSGDYTYIGSTKQPTFIDYGAVNGVTYYYGVTAYDFEGNESTMSRDVVYDTPRPEGYDVVLYNYVTTPDLAGYDFSTYSVGRYDDLYTDVFFENAGGVFFLNVWSDTDIQDMGYTETLDDISAAPVAGWSPSGSAEAIPGHTYVVWTWDNHFAKIRVTTVSTNSIVFDWAYQTAPANPELSRMPPAGGRVLQRKPRLSQ
ncbi:MAG: hypothetical protein HBSIN02_13630 [Bacteroidia bacterium]|nr:MAG: hypothetical protein HBSIN02_13630 [Bacteroidia bacterium]